MGQKVNPIGLRLGINRNWDSRWFPGKQTLATSIGEDYKIRTFLKKELYYAGVSQILIERTAKKLRVTVVAARPGIIIGKKGSDIEKLRVKLEEFKNELETALKDKSKDDGGFNAKTQKDGSKTGNIVSKTISGNTSTDDNKEQVLAKKSEAFFVLHGLEKIIDEKFTTTDGRVSFLNAFKENYSDVLSEKQMGKIDRVISEVINGKK